MRATNLGFIILGALVTAASNAHAADDTGTLPPAQAGPGASPADGAGPQGPASSAPPPGPEAPTETLPPPAPNTTAGTGAPSSTPAAAAPVEKAEDWKFSWHGYFRAPLRIGVGTRPSCANKMMPTPNGNGQSCAAPGQSTTVFHSPYVPDDQYLSWTFDRQWEQAWAEVFLSYGNKWVTGTVGLQGYDFTDASLLGNTANPAQFGIGQGWLSITPDLPVSGLRLNWKVGAFWQRYGMAGKYDGGHYDTYMFGRTHQVGEGVSLQYDVGDVTLKLEHGFGAHLEMAAAGVAVNGGASAQAYISNTSNASVPLGASPGFTLLHHAHLGATYKKILEFNAHYMRAWSQDDRTEVTSAYPAAPDGSMTVTGVEGRFLGGVFGELYAGYSHIDATNVTQVGPAIEVLHSQGGGGHNGGNGIYENFFNGVGNGNGQIDSVQVGYDFSFGYLMRKLENPRASFWGDGPDVRLSLFGMFSSVSGTDATSVNAFSGSPSAGTKKLKYGADLVYSALPWLGVGLRGDYVQPDSTDTSESFGVISPRVMVHTKFITHEEVTMQYSHYWDGADARAQQWLSLTGIKNVGIPGNAGVPYPNDADVFGIKATMWW